MSAHPKNTAPTSIVPLPMESPFSMCPVPDIDPELDLLGDVRSGLIRRIERIRTQLEDADERVVYYAGRRLAFQRQLDAAHAALEELQNA